MRVLTLVFVLVSIVSVSYCWADEPALKEAYSLYYNGEKETAIRMVEDYVRDNPDSGAYYFLGYAYYEMENMEKANEYFSEAFRLKDFYSPMPSKDAP